MDHSLLFEWDEAKSNRNRADRGFDFEYACQIFVRPVLEEDDRRHNYGESRIIATGEIGTETFRRGVHVARQPAPGHFRASCEEERTRCLP
jgi:uncharacterized DUF497 family protein